MMMEVQKIKIKAIREWIASGSINIFGMPFSGKDTHGTYLSELLGGPLIGGGEILRSNLTPKHVLEEIEKGHLAPTAEYRAIVLPYLQQEQYEGRPLVLSSIGRWIGEEVSVLDAAKEAGHPIKAVVYLIITEEEAWQRWRMSERQRHDDKAEHILKKRFSEFKEKTLPVIEEYRKTRLLIEVDAMAEKKVVAEDIVNQLYNFASAHKY
jgi:adenylate kinase